MAEHPYSDDLSIADSAVLWRRIHPMWAVPDENRGGIRVSSAAFDDSRDGSPTSILLAEIVAASGRSPNDLVREYEGYGLASLMAGQARSCLQSVVRDPLTDEPAHGLIVGPKTKNVKKQLASFAIWVISPHDASRAKIDDRI